MARMEITREKGGTRVKVEDSARNYHREGTFDDPAEATRVFWEWVKESMADPEENPGRDAGQEQAEKAA